MGKEHRDEMSFWHRKQSREMFQHAAIYGSSALALTILQALVFSGVWSNIPVILGLLFAPLIVPFLIVATDHLTYGMYELRRARSLARESDDAKANG